MRDVKYLPQRYRCGGYASHGGPCGAPDCLDCHPEMADYDWAGDDEEREIEIPDKVIRW